MPPMAIECSNQAILFMIKRSCNPFLNRLFTKETLEGLKLNPLNISFCW